MKINRTFLFVLGGNLAMLLLIYLPYAFRPLSNLEILEPGIYNIGLLTVDFFLALILSFIPSTQGQAKWWWLAFGTVLLISFPACLATAALNEAIQH